MQWLKQVGGMPRLTKSSGREAWTLTATLCCIARGGPSKVTNALSLDATSATILRSDLSAELKLERARTELLDLSANNRLLNIPRSAHAARIVEVVDEKSVEVHRLLVKEGRTFTFLPGRTMSQDSDALRSKVNPTSPVIKRSQMT